MRRGQLYNLILTRKPKEKIFKTDHSLVRSKVKNYVPENVIRDLSLKQLLDLTTEGNPIVIAKD
jgi:hypothetical protein